MKIISSLYTKVILFFILNLLLIIVALTAFLFYESHFFDSDNPLRIFMGIQNKGRTSFASRTILKDLKNTSQENWSEILKQHADIQGVDFFAVIQDGPSYSSAGRQIPKRTRARINTFFKDLHNKKLSPDFNDFRHKKKRFDQDHPDPEEIYKKEKRGRPPFLANFRTENPRKYWSGYHGYIHSDVHRKDLSVIIFAVSDSFTGNGFFFDPWPWFAVFAVTMFFSILLWIPLISSITAPLARMTQFAEKIARGDLDIRISEKRSDEIGRLALAINNMTTRLSGLVKGQKRFLGDIAHELGAPLARIQLGLGIMEQQLDSKNRKRILDITEDVTDLSDLVNELLSFSRAEVSPHKVSCHTIELLPSIERAVKREAGEDNLIKVDSDPHVKVQADPELIVRALSNLIRNALKYASGTGPVEISVSQHHSEVILTVRDHGPGVPDNELDQIFEPFFRTDPSRDRETGGVGLGLAIVKSCIHACGGSVKAENHSQGGFVVSLYLTRSEST